MHCACVGFHLDNVMYIDCILDATVAGHTKCALHGNVERYTTSYLGQILLYYLEAIARYRKQVVVGILLQMII